jgi:hypothetical protein
MPDGVDRPANECAFTLQPEDTVVDTTVIFQKKRNDLEITVGPAFGGERGIVVVDAPSVPATPAVMPVPGHRD